MTGRQQIDTAALRFALGLIGCVGVAVGCGDSQSRHDAAADAARMRPMDATGTADRGGGHDRDCNPITQTACAAGEKCTILWMVPELTPEFTTCAEPGIKLLGESCSIDPTSRIDDCERGMLCFTDSSEGRTCLELCFKTESLDTCAAGSCKTNDNLFYPGEGVCVTAPDAGL